MPAYNAARYLPFAIDSVLAQTFADWELVLVDDGSTDATGAVVDQYRSKLGSRLQYIPISNQGIAAARNVGLAAARGEFIALLDADDVWLPHRLERGVAAMEGDAEVGLVHARVMRIDMLGSVTGQLKVEPKYLSGRIARHIYSRRAHIICATVLFRKICLESAGRFDETMRVTEDRDLWFRIALRYKIAYINEVLAHYRLSPASITKNLDRLRRGQLFFVDKHYQAGAATWPELMRARGNIYREYGDSLFRGGHIGQSIGKYFRAVVYNPFNLPNVYMLVRALLDPLVRSAALLLLAAAGAWAATPHVFYTDLVSGPKTGGPNNAGAIVTIYGRGFGDVRGTSTVTIGGAAAAAYPLWGDGKIAVQIGPAAATGDLVVKTAAGPSNGAPFQVRAGNLFFVARNGSDTGGGKFHAPWRTMMRARDSMRPGDITYVMDGVAQTGDDGSGWNTSLLVTAGGTAAAPVAFVAYPNAAVTIGSAATSPSGVRSTPRDGKFPNYLVFAGFTIRGHDAAMALWGSTGWRIVANDFSCPNGDGAGACMDTVESSNLSFYGNHIHDTGAANASAMYHGVYFGTDSNHLDIGWNTIANVHGCRGIQVHSTPQSGEPNSGLNQFDISIHDNTIHHTQCDGIILDTIDPSQGPVSVVNNVVYNAGQGPNNREGSGGWSCIYVPGSTERGNKGSGTVEIANNTLYACGTFANPPYGNANAGIVYGGANGAIDLRLRNNILYQTSTSLFPSGVPYLVIWNPANRSVCPDSANCRWIQGSNNLFYGSGSPPRNTHIVHSLNSNPRFTGLAQGIFHLRPDSPAQGSGIGANEFVQASH